jgi:hypothetical protein
MTKQVSDLKKGQIWSLPTGTTITPVFKKVKIHWIDERRDLIHYHFVYGENTGIQQLRNIPLQSFLQFVNKPKAELIEDVADHG